MGIGEGGNLVIFDLNGVLVDSEQIVSAIMAEALRSIGIPVTEQEALQHFPGRRPTDIFAQIEAVTDRPLPSNFAANVAYTIMTRLRMELRATAHVAHALSWLRRPKCVVSVSSPERIRLSLDVTDLRRHFEHKLFSMQDLALGASKLDLLLHAAKRMNADAAGCVVVEDCADGIAAARKAGMMAIGYAGGSHAMPDLEFKLSQAGAHVVIHDMRGLKSALIDLRGY